MDIKFAVMIHLFFCSKNGVYHPVRHRIQPIYLRIDPFQWFSLTLLDLNLLLFQPAFYLLEIQYRINTVIMPQIHGFFLLGDTRT